MHRHDDLPLMPIVTPGPAASSLADRTFDKRLSERLYRRLVDVVAKGSMLTHPSIEAPCQSPVTRIAPGRQLCVDVASIDSTMNSA